MIPVALVLLAAGGVGYLVRLVRGPNVADRVVALDGLLTLVSTGIAAYGALHGEGTFLMVGVVVALVAFLATATFARFIEDRTSEDGGSGDGGNEAPAAAGSPSEGRGVEGGASAAAGSHTDREEGSSWT